MGITSSAEMAEGGIELQSQGDDNLWTVVLEGSEDGRGERVCLFSRTPGEGAVATRCKGSTEVSELTDIALYLLILLYILKCLTSQMDLGLL